MQLQVWLDILLCKVELYSELFYAIFPTVPVFGYSVIPTSDLIIFFPVTFLLAASACLSWCAITEQQKVCPQIEVS